MMLMCLGSLDLTGVMAGPFRTAFLPTLEVIMLAPPQVGDRAPAVCT
jgi:hypothetical protein